MRFRRPASSESLLVAIHFTDSTPSFKREKAGPKKVRPLRAIACYCLSRLFPGYYKNLETN